MRSFVIFCSAILTIWLVVSLSATDLASTDAISATATVVCPVGLLELRAAGDSLATPQLASIGSRAFLYLPRGVSLVLLDGVPLELASSRQSEHILSVLDITELLARRTVEHPAILTVILSNN